MLRQSKTAIIYFARSASEDQKQNRFSQKHFHGRLIDKLNRHTLRTIRATGLPILFSNEENQLGENLAQRLSHAFSEAFAKGYQNVIALGNDTPDLDANHILTAVSELASGNAVLGPSEDGGNYLIGLRLEDFGKEKFTVALENPDETNARLSAQLQNHRELEPLADIDDEKSLEAWLRSYSRNAEKILFRKEIKSTITNSETGQEFIQFFLKFCTVFGITDRGPPAAIAA